MISWRTIIPASAGPIFVIFSANESVLGADDRSGHVFPISQGTLRWQPILFKKIANPHFLSVWHSQTEWDTATLMCAH